MPAWIKRNAKALLLLAVIAVAGVAELAGVDLGLDVQHYVGLLLADLGVWAVPNRDDRAEAVE